MSGPSFQILGSGDALSWVCAGKLDCTWSIFNRRIRSHMECDEVLWWIGTDADEATASVTIFCRIWCCNFRSSCFPLTLVLPRSASTCAGAHSSLDCLSLCFRVCVSVCFAAKCLLSDTNVRCLAVSFVSDVLLGHFCLEILLCQWFSLLPLVRLTPVKKTNSQNVWLRINSN